MSDRDTLVDRLLGGALGEGEDPRAAQFARGLALGALVGAAIAGSTIWSRRRVAAERAEAAADQSLASVSEASLGGTPTKAD